MDATNKGSANLHLQTKVPASEVKRLERRLRELSLNRCAYLRQLIQADLGRTQ